MACNGFLGMVFYLSSASGHNMVTCEGSVTNPTLRVKLIAINLALTSAHDGLLIGRTRAVTSCRLPSGHVDEYNLG
jgi:hypothetical protein